ncbi:hypothetical protein [Ferrovibrio sp.]|uniref:hypothetical protein n=1 Tax=Ferrovibrio sp. TaxID=1917215 RepID=UPI00311D7E09
MSAMKAEIPEVIRNAPLKRGPRYMVTLRDGNIVIARRDGLPCDQTDLQRAGFVDKAADLLRVLKLFIDNDPEALAEAIKCARTAAE